MSYAKSKKLILILCFVGILISSYLAYAKITNNPLECGLSKGCDIVQNSKYSLLFGVPLGIWGILYYFGLFVIFQVEEILLFKKLRKIGIFWGLAFSLYLTYLEEFVINAYCLWCVASFINILFITTLYLTTKKLDNEIQ